MNTDCDCHKGEEWHNDVKECCYRNPCSCVCHDHPTPEVKDWEFPKGKEVKGWANFIENKPSIKTLPDNEYEELYEFISQQISQAKQEAVDEIENDLVAILGTTPDPERLMKKLGNYIQSLKKGE